MRDGDIYRWRWADEKRDRDRGSFGSYHCKSQIAVVRNGLLIDTFWSDNSSERAVDPNSVILTFVANVDDLTEIGKWNIDYYRPEDIVDMRHANNSSGPIYLRKGAARDKAHMLEVVRERISEHTRNIRHAQDAILRLNADEVNILEGKLDEVSL